MDLFYQPEGISATYLNRDESRHCLKVLRKKKGDNIQLVDGKGNFIQAVVSSTENQLCSYQVLGHQLQPPLKYYIHLVVAPTKNQDRIEWLTEKAVEIGVDEFSYVCCQHSERKHLNIHRLEKKAIAAMKQSLKAYLPRINPMLNLTDFLKQAPSEYEKFIGYVRTDGQQLKNVITQKKKYCLLIGPEGGFSKKEITATENAGFRPISLGKNRLRTETATLIGCHTFHLVNQ